MGDRHCTDTEGDMSWPELPCQVKATLLVHVFDFKNKMRQSRAPVFSTISLMQAGTDCFHMFVAPNPDFRHQCWSSADKTLLCRRHCHLGCNLEQKSLVVRAGQRQPCWAAKGWRQAWENHLCPARKMWWQEGVGKYGNKSHFGQLFSHLD